MHNNTVSKTILIGRGSDCDFVIADPTVSRHHATLTIYLNSDIYLSDCNSVSGVFIILPDYQLVRISSGWVQASDKLRLGDIEVSINDIIREFTPVSQAFNSHSSAHGRSHRPEAGSEPETGSEPESIAMYFWKTDILVNKVKSLSIDERAMKSYYLATSVLSVIGLYISMLGCTSATATLIECIGGLLLTIIGINYAFNANGGSTGTRFLEKIIVISFPLMVKLFVASLIAGFAIGVVYGDQLIGDWIEVIFILAAMSVFYWRLAFHIRHTNA